MKRTFRISVLVFLLLSVGCLRNTELQNSHGNGGTARNISAWHNSANPLDSNNDGAVTLVDAHLVIALLREGGEPNTLTEDPDEVGYLDVDGDGNVASDDAHLIVAYLAQSIDPRIWHHASNPADVDNDGSVKLVDAFAVGDVLRNLGNGATLRVDDVGLPDEIGYVDVNGDGRISLEDTDIVVARLEGKFNPADWQNPDNPLDVDASGDVTLLDAFQVIDAIRRLGEGTALTDALSDLAFVDVDGDNHITSTDANRVILYLGK